MTVPVQPDVAGFMREMSARIEPSRLKAVDQTWSLPTWNGLLCSPTPVIKTSRPSCCFTPACKDDVVAACALAARHGLRVSARGSGHHYGGVSMAEGALLLDLRELSSVQVDLAARTVRAGPAATGRTLRAALAPHGLHFPLPHLSDVGVSGFILGGGNGWGTRLYGAAADCVVEMEVVLLDGGQEGQGGEGSEGGARLVCVTAESDPELFWGLRGGGAFLGIALEFCLRLVPVPRALPLIAVTYPLRCLPELAAFFHEWYAATPPSFEASMSIVGDGGGDGADGSAGGSGGGTCAAGPTSSSARPAVVLACTAFTEPNSPEVEALYGKLRALLPEARLSLQEGPMPYEQALSILDPAWFWPDLCMYGHGAFLPVDVLARTSSSSSTSAAAAAAAAAVTTASTVTTDATAITTNSGDGTVGAQTQGSTPSATPPCAPAAQAAAPWAVGALAQAGASMTSRTSLVLLCPSAPSLASPAQGAAGGGGNGGGSYVGGGGGGPGRGALGWRDTFFLGIYAMWARSQAGPEADGDAAHVAWVRATAAALAPATLGLYVNEVMHDARGQVAGSYEAGDYERLKALKARVDPRGLLRAL